MINKKKDINNAFTAFYGKKDASGYLNITEEQLDQLTENVSVKYGVLFPEGEIIYPQDELDKWAIFIDEMLFGLGNR